MKSNPCPACEDRYVVWLIAHLEGFYGPRAEWTKGEHERFHELAGLLSLFVKDYQHKL